MRPQGIGCRGPGFHTSAYAIIGIVLLGLLVGPATAPGEIAVTATVDRTQLAVGESLVLTVAIAGAQNVSAPDLGGLEGFQARYQGPSTQVSIVNGQMSSSVSHRYWLVATREGTFSLGPFRVGYGGKEYSTAPIQVSVTARAQAERAAPGRAPAPDIPWLAILPAKNQAYVGERVPTAVKLYVGSVRVDDLQFPQIAGDGFALDALPQPAQHDEVVNGRRYRVLQFDTTLTPLRAGDLQVGPATMGLSILTSRRRGGFGELFSDMFATREPFEARGEAVALAVRALPEEGRPPDFTGAVGQFDFTVEAKPVEVDAGDPITVRMRLTGNGNLSTVQAPRVPVGEHFRAYDPQPVKDEETREGRVFEQVVIPKDATIVSIPAVTFSYFDPGASAYRDITRGPFPVTVRAAAAPQRPEVLVSESAPRLAPVPEKLGRGIVYIKDTPGKLRARGESLHGAWWFILMQAVAPVAFTCTLLLARRRKRLAADPRLGRFRRAGREARRALGLLSGSARDGADFFDELTAVVSAYLSAKLDLSPGAVECQRVLNCLVRRGVAQEVQQRTASFFELLERVRYAPGAASKADRETALELACGIIDRLERTRQLAERFSALIVFLGLLALGAGATGGARAEQPEEPIDPNTAFYEANAAYKAGRYAEAAAAYERIVARGRESGELYFNLGNTYFKTGQTGKAVLNYLRAERLVPRDPDIRANLGYAREQVDEADDGPPLWERLLFLLAHRATADELALVGSLFWWCFWIAWAVRLLLSTGRSMWGRAALVLAVPVVIVWGSLIVRVAEFDWSERAVVTSPGQTAVRFEPSAVGTEHFRVGEGTVLAVTDARDGWLQVCRNDGRRGWIDASSVGLL